MSESEVKPQFRCVLHGSFGKHFEEIMRVRALFESTGITVIAPTASEIASMRDGFALFAGEEEKDVRMIELLYLQNLKKLGENGFSYFVDPEGYIGKSASYELGIAQISNVRCFFSEKPKDHPVYLPQNSVWSPELMAEYIATIGKLPEPTMAPDEMVIHHLWENLVVPGSVVAVGGIIEYADGNVSCEPEILLVKTHKWGGRYSVVGGKVRRNERLDDALKREIAEETGLDSVAIGEHLCTFDQIKNSNYYQMGIQHIFVDKVVRVGEKRVRLNEEAEDYLWVPASVALRDLEIEPNARHTIELYARAQAQ